MAKSLPLARQNADNIHIVMMCPNPTMKLTEYFTAFLMLISCQWASGDVIYLPDQVTPVLRIEGQILKRDVKDFESALEHLKLTGKKLHMNAVQLNSTGGMWYVGRTIGRLIRREKLNTFVAPESECSSACVALLIGGVDRMAYGKVRVHRINLLRGEFSSEDLGEMLPQMDKEFAAYIKEMGVSTLLAEASLHTPTWSLRTLTKDEKAHWGVHGTERVFEEEVIKMNAAKLNISAVELADQYEQHFSVCDQVASRFEMTPHQCVMEKATVPPAKTKEDRH